MSERLKWGNEEFNVGDKVVSVYDYRLITLCDLYATEEGFGNVSVVLEIGDNQTLLMDADEFAYRMDEGHFVKIGNPLFTVGQSFTHHANNDTLEILMASDRPDSAGEYRYFVRMVGETGAVSYTSIEESYLSRCLAYERTIDVGIVLPEIEVNAVFPSIVFV